MKNNNQRGDFFGARLTTMSIQVSAGCNRACPFCPEKKYENFLEFSGQKGISDKVLDRLVEVVNEYKFDGTITFGWIDEPYLLDNFEGKVGYIRKRLNKKICLSVATNGDFLTKKRIISSFYSGINYIQVTHYDRDTYEDKVRFLSEICVKEKISFCRKEDNFIAGYLLAGKKDLSVIPGWRPPVVGGWNNRAGFVKNRLTIADSKVGLYQLNENRNVFSEGGWLLSPFRGKDLKRSDSLPLTRMCVMPFRRLVLYMNGKIGLCCNDFYGEVIVGDIMQQGIMESWELSSKMNLYRKHLLDKNRGILELCKVCNYYGGGYIGAIYKRVEDAKRKS